MLDLGCGPGLYGERLARLGWEYAGLDFSPASIAYAKAQAERLAPRPEYRLGDLRQLEFGEGFDLALFVYGELNVFRREDALALLRKALAALKPGGRMVAEVHAASYLREQAAQATSWRALDGGLFSEKPHLYLEERFWDKALSVLTTRYLILDPETGDFSRYAASVQAYTIPDYSDLFTEAGFAKPHFVASLEGPSGSATPFYVVLATKP